MMGFTPNIGLKTFNRANYATTKKLGEWIDDINGDVDSIIVKIDEVIGNLFTVSKTHEHLNKSIIDKFSADDEGNLLFDGRPIGAVSDTKLNIIVSEAEPEGQPVGGIWVKPTT